MVVERARAGSLRVALCPEVEVSEQTKAEIEALTEFTQSRGWSLFREALMNEVTGEFEDHITKALNSPDTTLAIDRARQVAAVRLAALRWLKWPTERMTTLRSELEKDAHAMSPAGRRGAL